MPYIGRDLNRGNYLKLDDISSSFNSSTKTKYQAYRQQLRDITKTYKSLKDVVWPTEPT